MGSSENITGIAQTQKLTPVKGDISEFEFDIIGMSCVSCASSIKTYLEKLDGISKADVNFASESGLVTYDPQIITRETIKKEINKLGYEITSDDEEYEAEQKRKQALATQKQKIIVSVSASLLTMLITMHDHIPVLNYIKLSHPLSLTLLFVLTTIIIFWCGDKFLKGAYAALKRKTSDMNTLIVMGSLSAYFYSVVVAANTIFKLNLKGLHNSTDVYFETAAMITTFILIGNYLEAILKSKTQSSIRKLKDMQAKVVNVLRDGQELFIPFKKVRQNDIALVKTGDKVPVDGTIIEGFCVVDESAMTGESLPVEKSSGDELMSGTILRNGFVKLKAERVGNETMLAKVISLVKDAANKKPRIQKLADKISSVFVPVVIVIAVVTFCVWYFILNSTFDRALLFAVSVLIIACPCALGLASPMAIVLGVGRAAENGILFTNVDAIENLKTADTICFDKTGTLTSNEIKVRSIYSLNNLPKSELMKYAYSIEKFSNHPIAKSIVNYGIENGINLIKDVSGFKNESGLGVSAIVGGKRVLAGNENFMRKNDIRFSNILFQPSKSNLFIVIDDQIEGIIELEDSIKPEAKDVIKKLRSLGLGIFMISGDNENAASRAAKELSIKNFSFKTLPDEKEKIVSSLQSENKNVIMVGDGINDAPSLARANVGMAIGSGQDIAIDSADVVLVKDDLESIPKSIKLSKKTVSIIKQNFFWAFFYNAAAIPFAAGVFAPFGIVISPVMAAMLMAFSDVVTVIGNSLRLKYYKL